jgi:hypothetical protein
MKKLVILLLFFVFAECTYSQSTLIKVIKTATKGAKTEAKVVAKKSVKKSVKSSDEVLGKGVKKSNKLGAVRSKSKSSSVVEDILQPTKKSKVKNTEDIFNTKIIEPNTKQLDDVDRIFKKGETSNYKVKKNVVLTKNINSWASKANYTLKKNKRSISVFNADGVKLGTIVKNGEHQVVTSFPLLGKKLPNPILDRPLLPNTTYKVKNVIYKTDKLGRPIKSSVGRITKNDINRTSVRGKTEQQIALENGGLGGNIDHGGHLMAHKFGGAKGALNIVAQLGELNLGDFKRIEDYVFRNGSKIKNYEVEAYYKGSSFRPEKFKQSFEFLGASSELQGLSEQLLKKGKKLSQLRKEFPNGKEYFECLAEHINKPL